MSREVTLDHIEIEEIAYHRNGIGGVGFHVVNFLWKEDGTADPQKMIGVCFELSPEDEKLDNAGRYYNPPTAVFNRDLLALNDITFGSNSWRGDTFNASLRAAIKEYNEQPYESKV